MNAIIIGATQGLGFCLTKRLLEGGHRVAAGTLENEPPAALSALKRDFAKSLSIFPCDVVRDAQIMDGAAHCLDFFGQADSLCNVAGVILKGDRDKLLTECDPDELRKTFSVNTIGAILVVRYYLHAVKKNGSFFTVTSEGVGVQSAGSWIPCYGLSKTAATKACGIFNASYKDADFYAVHPGRMNTELGRTTAQIEPEESAEGFYKLMTGETPISREKWYIDYKGIPMNLS